MKFATFLSFASLILSASAYGVVGTYERMWFWYAYQMDTASEIATDCGKTMGAGAGNKCSFRQFMEWINLGMTDPNKPLNPSVLDGVDPDDLPAATAALNKGNFVGKYDCTRVWFRLPSGTNGATNNVSELFRKLGYYTSKMLNQGSTADQKTQMKQVVQAVLRGRQANALPTYETEMAKLNPPINVATRDIPMYDGAPTGADYTVQAINADETRQNSPGFTGKRFRDAVDDIAVIDKAGHKNNIQAAQEAYGAVEPSCVG